MCVPFLNASNSCMLIREQSYQPGLPVVSFRFSDDYREQNPDVPQKWVQTLLRAKGWIVPNYELAPDLQNVEILRVVVRESVTADMVDRLVGDLVEIVDGLAQKHSQVRALAALEGTRSAEAHHGKLPEGHGSKSNGTYAKPC